MAAIALIAPQLLGDIDITDLQAVLDQLLEFGGAGPGESSQSAAFTRTITEVQAGELADYLEAQLMELRRANVYLASIATAYGYSQAQGQASYMPGAAQAAARAARGGTLVQIGDVTAGVDVSDSQLRGISKRVAGLVDEQLYIHLKNKRGQA